MLANEGDRLNDNTIDKVCLYELAHNSGVNALAANQVIKFNPQVNIIYGLNGTGKSSYFRIMNEIIGGANPTIIRPNIYKDTSEPISVSIKYKLGSAEKRVNWDGTYRGIDDLRTIRVFDSFYTRDLLKKRTSDELVVKPYGLSVFSELIQYIDMIIEKANEIIQHKRYECPEVKSIDMAETIRYLIQKEEYQPDDIITLKSIMNAEIVAEDKIREQEDEVINLRVGNPKDKIALLNAQLKHVEKTVDFLKRSFEYASRCVASINELVTMYHCQSMKCEDYRKKLEILKDIPGTDSKIWKEFISKGIDYTNKYHLEECPFCHQPLSNHANDIINSYILFLDNTVQVQLVDTEQKMVNLHKEIEDWSVNWELENDRWSEELISDIRDALEILHSYKYCIL